MIVAAGFMCNFIIFGFAFTFGVFQDFYLSKGGPLYGKPVATVSIIGTLATSLTYMVTIGNNVLQHFFSIQQTMVFGSLLMAMGLISASWAQEIWQFALSQGVMFGIGGSLTYLPAIVHAPPYFSAHRGIAMGILFSGTGIGGLALAPLTRYLITKYGWQWALRICGIITFVCLLPATFLVHPHPNYVATHKLKSVKIEVLHLNMSLVTSKKFIFHMTGALLQSAGYLIPGYYMSSYGQTLGFSSNEGAVFIGINNAVNAVSKVIVGYFADNFGRLNMLLCCCFLSTVTAFALWLVSTRGTLIAFVILYGVVSGPIISLLPTCMVELFGVQHYQSSTWSLYFCRGVGKFLGSPVAGSLIKHGGSSAHDYQNAIIYNGILFVPNFLCFTYVRAILASENNWKIR
ncbi:hypothetical protein SUVZ_12G4820 [Saccharomyces uvarum]|uniref:Major facilitator superfamily (MFS) profile domain-containing protein n=1 Tax=Saccharomyces uvarum TaxID=230603 RepID=A0ABN8WMM7_SACUV|nr:hypothetical protein SUVZ_12G4820 [Saccharomyces uvarum]